MEHLVLGVGSALIDLFFLYIELACSVYHRFLNKGEKVLRNKARKKAKFSRKMNSDGLLALGD